MRNDRFMWQDEGGWDGGGAPGEKEGIELHFYKRGEHEAHIQFDSRVRIQLTTVFELVHNLFEALSNLRQGKKSRMIVAPVLAC
jgi:hypothetical protein